MTGGISTFCLRGSAARQAGVVSREQLIALGFTRREIELMLKSARLIRIHRGVYAVGHAAITDRGRIVAALLAAGPGATVSHGTAAHVYTLIPSMPPFVHLTFTDRARESATASRSIKRGRWRRPSTDSSPSRRRYRLSPNSPRAKRHEPATRRSFSASSHRTKTTTPSPPAASWSRHCSLHSRPPACHGRTSTSASSATRSTSTGPSSA